MPGHAQAPRQSLARQEGLAETVDVSLVEVCEVDAPPGAAPILWRLLTTHRVEDAAMARAAWLAGHRQRWHIEQFFRTLKQQGLQLEDSQLENAERLIKRMRPATQRLTPISASNSRVRVRQCD